ncbi:MAG: GDP-mannose 4,6-dehydratase [Betaproteobacteria bacterium]|nr:GDP-mannose 4,6-dehydratase [Betaproteobacteria bacterium]
MRALICGVNGQDGSYLAQLLLNKGYEVWGTSRDIQGSSLSNLRALSIDKKIHLISMAPNDFRSVFTAVEQSDPDEIYYLSGQSSVGLSFEQPVETLDSIVSGVLNLLEIMRLKKKPIRFYNASSSECFGENGNLPANEATAFHPRSPYGVAKASAHWMVTNYRESYGLFACNGILFNHESPLRQSRFVTQKIINAACRIAAGEKERLELGRLDIVRDWGWAPEYVDAMWRMLQNDQPCDYVIATGEANSLEKFVQVTFDTLGLDWRQFVSTSENLLRPADLAWSQGDPSRAARELNWVAQKRMNEVISGMIADRLPTVSGLC